MMNKSHLAWLSLSIAAASMPALATEGGGSSYPVGVENYTCCALPPPGVYGMVYGQSYRADSLRDNDGEDASPSADFEVSVNAVVPRVVWVTNEEIAGGSLAFHTIVPLVDLEVDIAPGVSDTDSGVGDIVLGTALGWHHSPQLHTVAVFDVTAPTGSYDEDEIANIGRNHWAMQAVYGVSRIDNAGLNYGLKSMWTYNFENSATDYKDGQELIFDYALGWGLGNGFIAGVGGYFYQQITDDQQNGDTVDDARGRAFAVGPDVRYDSGKGWFISAKYSREMAVRNRAEGDALWIKAVMPF